MVQENIEKATLAIEERINERYLDEFFLRLYSFTNENLKGFMDNFDFQNKKILTTGSSCDQILNLISYGASDISCFDINPLVKYYYELKKAAILYLSRDKYLDFLYGYKVKNNLITGRNKVLNPSTYSKITKYMDKESITFWDELYRKYSPIQIKKGLFMQSCELSRGNIIKNNRYLDEEYYQKIKKSFDKISPIFYKDSLPKLKKISDKYDYIYLSNIFDYILNLSGVNPFEEAEYEELMIDYKNILRMIRGYLNQTGILFYHYIWDYQGSNYEILYTKYLKSFSDKINFPSNHHINYHYDVVLCADKEKIRVLDRK